MKIFALAVLAGQTTASRVLFDDTLSCDDFDSIFPDEDFTNMKTKCRIKRNKKKTKAFCNLLCENGQHNVWSTKPIKCKQVRKAGSDDFGLYKWRPDYIKDAESLCDVKERCPNANQIYNLTNKLLTASKSVDGRRTWWNFTCGQMENDGKVFDMIPFPTDHVTCTCNFNKPSNVRCKWSKVKNSIVRCVRKDKEDKFFDGGIGLYDDMYTNYEEDF